VDFGCDTTVGAHGGNLAAEPLPGPRRSTEQYEARHVAMDAQPKHRWRCREIGSGYLRALSADAGTVSVLG
jgi:hypothetical protein